MQIALLFLMINIYDVKAAAIHKEGVVVKCLSMANSTHLLVNIMPTQRLPINVYSMKGFSISVYHREMCLHIELQCVPSVHLQSSHTNVLTLS